MYKLFGKRTCDVILSCLLFPFFIIICLIVKIAILFDDRGPLFYMSDRLGKNGKTFLMYKFRSMKTGSPDLRNKDGTTFNSKDDVRMTKVGKVLRKTSLDEIPQIINILKGEMSFVGPRPDMPDAIKLYSVSDRKKLDVAPGITGYSQAKYRNSSTLQQRFEGDVFYAQNVSLLLDIKIFFLTIKNVLIQENVYRKEGEYDEDSDRQI